MDKNYYDWLEVSKTASNEVIEKAYKTLVKKYHPDLQEGTTKTEYEDILKHINEAYEILSDPIKRENYDKTLEGSSFSEENYENLYKENQNLKNTINYMNIKNKTQQYQNKVNNKNSSFSNTTQNKNVDFNEYAEEMNNAIKKAYYDAYIQDLKNRGYKIKYKKSFKDYLKTALAIIITVSILILIGFILWQIPFTRNYFIELYNSNDGVRLFVNIFKRLFK